MASSDGSGRLFALLKEQRARLIQGWSQKIRATVADASLPRAELLDHIPAFVDELTQALYPDALPLPPGSPTAAEHGEQRLRLGFNVSEVVREYGALHACILDLAGEAGVTLTPQEQGVVQEWISTGVADAVGEYVRQRDLEFQRQASEHLGFIAHEVRNPLGGARLALDRLRREAVSPSRALDMMDRNLRRASDLIDNVLNQASLQMGLVPRPMPVELASFLAEIADEAGAEADTKSIQLSVHAPPGLVIQADPRLLRSAVSNLLHNALKFTPPSSKVTMTAAAVEGRVRVEVADGCGGLPPGKVDELFMPLVQRGADRRGFGLGLAIALQAAEAHHGTIRVEDRPGLGCAFIIDLPLGDRHTGGKPA
jgi:signal transduction histidine kinase